MGDKTRIEWTDATWNPVTGCDKVSPGCDHCYAETFAERWRGTRGHYFETGFDVQLRPDKLDLPLRWTKPRRIFVNSMSDLFHARVPDEYIARVFAVMALAPQHTFQVLTKRHGRMRSLLSSAYFLHAVSRVWAEPPTDWTLPRDWSVPVWPLPNVWLGVSAEDQKRADLRIPALLDTPAAVRFVSAEPLLGPIDLHGDPIGKDSVFWIGHLDWVIVGGESGPGARPMHPDWARSMRDQCVAAGVPFLFKQWGEHRIAIPGQDTWDKVESIPLSPDVPMEPGVDIGPWAYMRRVGKKRAGRELDGRTWDQYPEVA
ncbi:bacteriophage protein gp37 [Mycobacteroides abscessus subsp. abscessus]|uniref:Bacteriophage protein gp37 n=1 Tax=Mycobacteroides abscessus subsp. abscessus TaxID=1185650 RepID=A0AB38CZT0_9MYCO|nr:phage Gp37/Gp68 family protein [Mycobacteroides abscessus]SHW42905.1 bacteriophage protein gp37 [Mycobacteroides abscessus subsp. abscessus]SIA24117.1 bacteriophage protein gp37 [Mycobacteroides abscessus subsp. abscessus]SIB00906.1 bacteriophage protein gp37 [Mycobacteroides abscessus subsp. abscessus]SIB04168.1 bacteriophage protein gp37 [Mycobacteroides abscessus subsp. abscessus]SIB08137.1 bacteriophage protein gp37 [Mycobacteroides abscessus subsp. abscessus]